LVDGLSLEDVAFVGIDGLVEEEVVVERVEEVAQEDEAIMVDDEVVVVEDEVAM
ncbi:hypothetical protein KI387_043612, partial [Taxus chinensis]